jgi:phospholipase C
MINRPFYLWICAIPALVAVSACGPTPGSFPNNGPSSGQPATVSSPSPIQHIVIVVQENRTFNDFFATFPGGDGTTTGTIAKDAACHIPKTETIALTEGPLATTRDFVHVYGGFATARWFYPNTTGTWTYHKPAELTDGWSTGTLSSVGCT